MDLLLYLVRRNKVDILELPLAKVATQFLEFLNVLQFWTSIGLRIRGDGKHPGRDQEPLRAPPAG